MLMLLWNPLRRWWATGDGPTAASPALPAGPVPALLRRRALPSRRPAVPGAAARPVTPFGGATRPEAPTAAARRAARRFWMRLDPEDRRHGAIGGSFAEICAALERLASLEEQRPH